MKSASGAYERQPGLEPANLSLLDVVSKQQGSLCPQTVHSKPVENVITITLDAIAVPSDEAEDNLKDPPEEEESCEGKDMDIDDVTKDWEDNDKEKDVCCSQRSMQRGINKANVHLTTSRCMTRCVTRESCREEEAPSEFLPTGPLRIGQRVRVRWGTSKLTGFGWYDGCIADVSTQVGAHDGQLDLKFRVTYDDGYNTWHSYAHDQIVLLDS